MFIKKRKRATNLGILLFVFSMLCGCFPNNDKKLSEKEIDEYEESSSVVATKRNGDISYILIESGSVDELEDKYYLEDKVIYQTEKIIHTNKYKKIYDQYIVEVFEIGSGELVKEINVKEILDKNLTDEQKEKFVINQYFEAGVYEGKECLFVSMSKTGDWGYYFIIDINSDYISFDEDKTFDFSNVHYADSMKYLETTNILDINDLTFIKNLSYNKPSDETKEGILTVDIWYESLMKLDDDARIFKEFPNLKGEFENLDQSKQNEYHVRLFIRGKSDIEVVELFLSESKTTTLDNLYLNSEWSIDEKPHRIETEEDFYTYFNGSAVK